MLSIPYFVWHRFTCQNKDQKFFLKKIENVQNHNMFERWIKKSQHLKNSFYGKYDQDPN